jgi:hypothetical protein
MDSELTERPKNICDTCGQPYAVNANYDKHDCRLEPAKVWLEENVWSEGDTQEETAANLKALLDSEIAEWLTDFAAQHTADLRQQLDAARDERDAYKDACEGYEMIIAEGREDELTESVKQTTNKLINRLAESNMNLNVIAEKAREFVFEPETWEGYEDLKTSNSAAIPPEFMALCEAVEDRYGTPTAALSAADDVREGG